MQSMADEPDVAKLVEKGKKKYVGTGLKGKSLGVIGLGAIGVGVANTCTLLGMDVYGYDPFISVSSAWNVSKDIHHVTNVEEIYETCDYITLHVPLMETTRKMINAEAFSKMKDGVVLLNLARDTLVDDEALEAAIQSGKVRRYVTDFPNAKTAGMAGVLAFPHLGASTIESEDNCAVMAVDELTDYLENGNIAHSVNFPDLSMGKCTTGGRLSVFHRNIPGMISSLTNCVSDANNNIEHMTNKSKGDWSYNLLDVNDEVTDDLIQRISAIEGVIRVRKVK